MRNLYAEITARILAQLEGGRIPWRQPWSNQASGAMPRNAVTGRGYSGANVPLLWATAQERGYTSPKWLTFKQALEAGGNVRKGERGTLVVYVNYIGREQGEGDELTVRRIPFLKAFTVFNLAQCEGLEALADPAPKIINPDERRALADAFLDATGARIRYGEPRAYYTTAGDFINLPPYENFRNASAFYNTAFHELTHWTGAKHRLDRTFGRRFGDDNYRAEELVAELGSAFLCAEFGFDNDTVENHVAYLQSWSQYLRDHERAFVAAAAAASRAVEYMRGLALGEEAAAA